MNTDSTGTPTDKHNTAIVDHYFTHKPLGERIREKLKSSPWWLTSIALHTIAILILINIMIPLRKEAAITIVSLDRMKKPTPKLDDPPKKPVEPEDPQDPVYSDDPVDPVKTDLDIPVAEIPTPDLPPIDTSPSPMVDPTPAPNPDFIGVGPQGSLLNGTGPGGDGGGPWSGRGRGPGGPTHPTDVQTVVDRALRYLARTQEADGSWQAGNHEGKQGVEVGITAACTFAFLGAGHTELSGNYRRVVRRALAWLLKQQGEDGIIADKSGHYMYQHGLASLALCEAYGMTGNPKVKRAAVKALDAIFAAQSSKGGWDYTVRDTGRSDTSVEGWQLMAIKSAKMAKLPIDMAKVNLALQNIKNKTNPSTYRVGYTSQNGSSSMAAVGMAVKRFFGAQKDSPDLTEPAAYLLQNLPGSGGYNDGYYYVYYGALAMFQNSRQNWRKWSTAMKPFLTNTQIRDTKKNPLFGSWPPVMAKGNHGVDQGGRVMVTAFYCLAMEVYWIYPKMYQ